MLIDHVQQQTTEQKIYTVDYSDWLVTNEELTAVAVTIDPIGTTPDLIANAVILTNKTGIELTVSEGEALKSYSVSVNVTTSNGQKKTDCFVFSIYTACDGAA